MNDQHNHDGLNSPQIDPSNLLGFRITTTAPTHQAPEGTILLYSSGGTYRIYCRINKGWRYVNLT